MVQEPTEGRATQETILDGGGPRKTDDESILEQGALVGRYVILKRIGSGGMGVVYSAYDPELDRRVALKRLHLNREVSPSRSDGVSRLLVEAQAMARLSHANVVTVHDVGVHDKRVFLAMEFVEGETLGAFMKKGRHAWSAVMAIFDGAGRGLAAAHEAGLVHRDFKPENVLLGAGGKVKVTDFGLAQQGQRPPRLGMDRVGAISLDKDPREEERLSTLASATHSGAVQGTPAYMAPEQHMGLPTDSRSDQFSFCVALYEALYGEPPFTGAGRAALAISVTEGRVRDAPAGSRVPAWIRQLLLKGLQPRPQDRHVSMVVLLDALAKDPGARGRQAFGWIAAASVVGVAGFGLASSQDAKTQLCAGMDRHLVGVWDASAKENLRKGFTDSGVGFAESTFARVDEGLDMYAGAWIKDRRESCEATQLRGEQSQGLMDLRMACLDGRLQELASLIGVLTNADSNVAQKAVTAVGELPGLDTCSNAKALQAGVAPPDADVAAAVAELRGTLAQVHAMSSAGQYEPGLKLATVALKRARELGYAPTIGESLYSVGVLQHSTGAEKEAQATLEEAFFSSVREQLDELAARSAAQLIQVVGKSQAQAADGRKWANHALANAIAVGDERIRATALLGLANVAHQESSFEEAKQLGQEALAIRRAELGEKHASLLAAFNVLGLVASDTGNSDEAQAYYEEGLTLGGEILGRDHPDLARFLNNLAKIAWMQGKIDEAEKNFELALDLQTAALGPKHRNVAQLHNNLAAVAASRGDMEEAGRRFELALDIWIEALGPEHPSVADGLNNLAVVQSGLHRYEKAKEYDERALELRLKTMDAGHPAIAQNYNNLGEDLRHLGDLEGALELHRQSLELWEAKLGPDHDDVGLALSAIAYDLCLLGRHDEALPLAERAMAIRLENKLDPLELATTKWTLALALWAARPGKADARKRARALAGEALEQFQADEGNEYLAETLKFVESHP